MLDIVGVGFGPSNLALAVCIQEAREAMQTNTRAPLNSVFLERGNGFQWHKGMLIEGATMQISFLKDLVTLRDPTSRFSFLNYLKHCGRLEDFANLKSFYPTRMEYFDYLKWVAMDLVEYVRYGCLITDIKPNVESDGKRGLEVVVKREGQRESISYLARNIVIGVGHRPRLPVGIAESPRISHSSNFLEMIERPKMAHCQRFLVVGSGQSAAEIINFLHDRYTDARIVSVFSGFGYKPADDSSFINGIFDCGYVDEFYRLPQEVKSELLRRHADTNYSVVDIDLISELYRKVYIGKVR